MSRSIQKDNSWRTVRNSSERCEAQRANLGEMELRGIIDRCRILCSIQLRHSGGMLIACAVLSVTATPAQCQTQSALQTPADGIQFRLQTLHVVEDHLRSFSIKNSERETLIRRWLAKSGCKANNLSEQVVADSFPPNVICVLPGETQRMIVVGAHTDHVARGDGVVDNWTGAVLLPALLYSLSGRPHHHTFVFVGFSVEEKGLIGSRYYADHLTDAQRARIDAMVNFDSLGLGPTEVWASHADKILLDALDGVAKESNLPLSVMNPENGATADSESFARYHIPRVTLHSVTEQTWSILHSPRDQIFAIKMNDYYDSYKLISEYLAYLDGALMCCASQQ
jgi:hypothetical protein